MWYIIGLGNPGLGYEKTRHNSGAMVLEVFRKFVEFPDWVFDKKRNSLVTSGELKTSGLQLIFPQTFMNKSGEALRNFQFSIFNFQKGNRKKEKGISNLVVIHDDLDIPFGSYKISFNKSSGGHRGVESVIKAVKTEAFVRVRIGISPTTPRGEVRKPKGEAAVERHILGKFSPAQLAALKKLSKRIAEGLVCLVAEGRERAMSQYHS